MATRPLFRNALFGGALLLLAHANATEYVVPAGADVGRFFAELPPDATSIVFSAAARYTSEGDIVLPDAELLVIDGKGCHLALGPGSNGFTRRVADQQEAMRKTACRYAIRDFGMIEGGRKAIDLQATLGSTVMNCRMKGQTEIAIDLRFCLLARLQNVLVTHPHEQGIVVRIGDWPGANWSNSQSNSTVLEQCRVFCASTTTNAFAVLNSGGVRMLDCVSEGAEADRDLYLSAVTDSTEVLARNSVVKSFTLENFHVEHKLRQESIHVNMPPQAAVVLRNIYWNGPQTAPVIRYLSGQLNLSDIGWWADDFRIVSRVSAPRINVQRCHSKLRLGAKDERTATKAGSFGLVNPLPGNDSLKLDHVRVVDVAR